MADEKNAPTEQEEKEERETRAALREYKKQQDSNYDVAARRNSWMHRRSPNIDPRLVS